MKRQRGCGAVYGGMPPRVLEYARTLFSSGRGLIRQPPELLVRIKSQGQVPVLTKVNVLRVSHSTWWRPITKDVDLAEDQGGLPEVKL